MPSRRIKYPGKGPLEARPGADLEAIMAPEGQDVDALDHVAIKTPIELLQAVPSTI